MKYQLKPKVAQFNKNGFVTTEGWTLIYNTNIQTGEFINATYEYVAEGVGLPSHVCLDAPDLPEQNHAIVRVGDKWTYPADHRGKEIYSTETGEESIVKTVGDILNGFTLLKPTSVFDSWDGEKWVLDKEKQHLHDVEVAQSQQSQLLNDANVAISNLQDAVDAEIATEQQIGMLKSLKKYRFELNQVDVNTAPNIDWPENPV